jgi:hypothetical protein
MSIDGDKVKYYSVRQGKSRKDFESVSMLSPAGSRRLEPATIQLERRNCGHATVDPTCQPLLGSAEHRESRLARKPPGEVSNGLTPAR